MAALELETNQTVFPPIDSRLVPGRVQDKLRRILANGNHQLVEALADNEASELGEDTHRYARVIWQNIAQVAEEWSQFENERAALPQSVLIEKCTYLPITRRIQVVGDHYYFNLLNGENVSVDREEVEDILRLDEWELYLLTEGLVRSTKELGDQILFHSPLFSFLWDSSSLPFGYDSHFPQHLSPVVYPLFWTAPTGSHQQWWAARDTVFAGLGVAEQAELLAKRVRSGSAGVIERSFIMGGKYTRPVGEYFQEVVRTGLRDQESFTILQEFLQPYISLQVALNPRNPNQNLAVPCVDGKTLLECTFDLLKNNRFAEAVVRSTGVHLINEQIANTSHYAHLVSEKEGAFLLEYCTAALLIIAQLMRYDPCAEWRGGNIFTREVKLPHCTNEADIVIIPEEFARYTGIPRELLYGVDNGFIFNRLALWDEQLASQRKGEYVVEIIEVKTQFSIQKGPFASVVDKKHDKQLQAHFKSLRGLPWQNIRWRYNILTLSPWGNTLIQDYKIDD